MSACYEDWAHGVAGDPGTIALIDELPSPKRQPNLVFTAARFQGAPIGPYHLFRDWLHQHWLEVRATALTHATQTNEAGRCALHVPALAGIEGPLALLEVGASAGLCLYPDRYSYRYTGHPQLDPADGAERGGARLRGRAARAGAEPAARGRLARRHRPQPARRAASRRRRVARRARLARARRPPRAAARGRGDRRGRPAPHRRGRPQRAARRARRRGARRRHPRRLPHRRAHVPRRAAVASASSSTVRALPGHWLSVEAAHGHAGHRACATTSPTTAPTSCSRSTACSSPGRSRTGARSGGCRIPRLGACASTSRPTTPASSSAARSSIT